MVPFRCLYKQCHTEPFRPKSENLNHLSLSFSLSITGSVRNRGKKIREDGYNDGDFGSSSDHCMHLLCSSPMEPDAIFQERSPSWNHGLASFWWNHRVSQTRTRFHEEPKTQVQRSFSRKKFPILQSKKNHFIYFILVFSSKINILNVFFCLDDDFGSYKIWEFLQISHSWLPNNSLNGRRAQ